MKMEDFLTHEQSRMQVYRFLAECYQLPNENLIENLDYLSDHMSVICNQAASCVYRMKEVIGQLDDLEQLKIDYAKLFVGPYKLLAPPYGSVYLEGERKVMSDSTLDVKDRYREAGLNVAEDFKEPPDHVAAELEFMYFLIFKEIEAITHSDVEDIVNYMQEQQSFLENHLGAWMSDFTKNIIANSDSEFYKKLAKSTKIFINQELQIYRESHKIKLFNDIKHSLAHA